MKRNYVYKYAVGVIVIGILLMLNLVTENKLSFNLSPVEEAGVSISYEPHLSLPKGEYAFHMEGDGTFTVSNYDGAKLGEGSGTIDVKLEKDESTIIIKAVSGNATRVTVEKNGPVFLDTLFVSLFIIVFLLYIGYVRYKSRKDPAKAAVVITLIAVALVASYPVLSDYIVYGQDINFHLYRIEGLKDGLLSGQFPVRLDPSHNKGYGYITASIYPGLFLYFPALLRLCGVSLITSYELFLFMVNLATAFIMYGCTKRMTKSRFAGLFAAVVYTLSTWRMENMIYRAAIGETLAMTFFPVVILGLYEILKGDRSRWWILTLGCSAVFHSHVISCIFSALLICVMLVVFIKDLMRERRWFAFVKSAAVTFLANLWYLIPFATCYFGVDMVIHHKPANTEYFSNAVFPAQMFNLFNNQFGVSRLLPDGMSGDMSLTLGAGVTFCLVAAAFYFIFADRTELKNYGFYKALFVFAAFTLFMSSTLFPSELLQKLKVFNWFAGVVSFPWRLLSLASPVICMVSAAVVAVRVKSETFKKVVIGMACLVCSLVVSVFGTEYTTGYECALKKGQAASEVYATGWDNEYMIWGTDMNLLIPEKYTASDGSVKILSYDKQGTNISLDIEGAADGTYIEVPLLNYPGYSAKNDKGEKLEITCGDNNVLRIHLTEDTDRVSVRYTGMFSFKAGCVISVLTVLYLAVFAFSGRKRNVKRRPAASGARINDVP